MKGKEGGVRAVWKGACGMWREGGVHGEGLVSRKKEM